MNTPDVRAYLPLCKRGIKGDLCYIISPNPPNPFFSKKGIKRLLSENKTNSCLFLRLLIPIAIVLFSGCASVPDKTPAPQGQPPIITYALSLQGVPYRYGKDSPEEGFDCSGFVKHVYEKQGIKLPRTVKDMALYLPPIPKNAVHSGDLVFFNTNGKSFSHVGIYVNNDKFVHAPSQRTGRVLVSSLKNQYWHKHYIGARRPGRF